MNGNLQGSPVVVKHPKYFIINQDKIVCTLIWVTLSESFRTSIRGFSGSNHEDIFWNFPNWSTSNLRNWVSIYRQLQADCLYHVNCLYNFPAYTWRQKRNAFPGLCSGSIFMIQKNLIIISITEPRILCSEVIHKNNSSMTQLSKHLRQERWNVMEPVRKHWRQGRFERKRGNAETFNLFNAFMVSKVFNELHCLYCPSLPILSFCAFYILQCPSVQKAELWALRACYFCDPKTKGQFII